MEDTSRIALALEEIASLLELSGERHKARAYARGADIVATLGNELAVFVRDGRLTDIDGIGASLARQIEELWTTERSSLLERLHATYPEGSVELASLPGITTRRLSLLREELGVQTIEALRDACLAQRVRALRGFGEKTEQRLLEAIAARDTAPATPKQLVLADVLLLTSRVRRQLVGHGHAKELQLAGEARRAEEVVSAIDWLAIGARQEPLLDQLARSTLAVRVGRKRYCTYSPPIRGATRGRST